MAVCERSNQDTNQQRLFFLFPQPIILSSTNSHLADSLEVRGHSTRTKDEQTYPESEDDEGGEEGKLRRVCVCVALKPELIQS